MSAPDADRVQRIFSEALRRSIDERAGYVRERCGDDDELRARIEDLLHALDEAGAFMSDPTNGAAAVQTISSPSQEQAGQQIGRYKLLQQIGEGGFGSVWMAEQREPINRRVALKIIKLGMDSKQVIARFEAERQALALMEHPNIARVLDAGTSETGRPYFVMELVHGVPITTYCDTENLPTGERLRLFISVCRAVQHAHQKGIIHRDLKPSNVMVTLHDGEPIPKVIDFGIAKAMNRELSDRTLFTEYGRFLGTPEYMSPEQAEMSGLDIDTRSDIYSLGVLLYELLTGMTPFDGRRLRSAGIGEIQRIIREEAPAKPSTRLSQLGAGAAPSPAEPASDDAGSAEAIARHRRTDPNALSRQLRGDLDWIIMKSLEKDRSRRYETADRFAADVMSHLENEPVEAGPPGVGYRLGKFVRRHRTGVMVSGLVVASVIVASAALLSLQRETARARVLMDVLAAEQEAMRERLGGPEIGPEELRLRNRLLTEIVPAKPELFEQALQRVARILDCELAVEWNALAELGVEATSPVQGISGRAVDYLDDVFSEADTEARRWHRLDFTVRGGTLVVSTNRAIDRDVLAASYDVAALVGEDAFQLQALIDTIRTFVDPEGWYALGGNTGGIEPHASGRLLIIRTTTDNHLAIRTLLRALQNVLEHPIGADDMAWPDGPQLQSLPQFTAPEDSGRVVARQCAGAVVESVGWSGVPFHEAVHELSGATGIPIVPTWPTARHKEQLAEQVRNAPIDLRIDQASLPSVLETIAGQLPHAPESRWIFDVRDGQVMLVEVACRPSSPRPRAERVRAYDVSDILEHSRNSDDPAGSIFSRVSALCTWLEDHWQPANDRRTECGPTPRLDGIHDTVIAAGTELDHATLELTLQSLRRDMGLLEPARDDS